MYIHIDFIPAASYSRVTTITGVAMVTVGLVAMVTMGRWTGGLSMYIVSQNKQIETMVKPNCFKHSIYINISSFRIIIKFLNPSGCK